MKKEKFQYTTEFDKNCAYDGEDLGAVCGEGKTRFKIWAPFAEKVELCLYKEGTARLEISLQESLEQAQVRVPMEKEERGVWSFQFDRNLHGYFYDFLLYNKGETVRTADPYARGCCCNGQRSMVVDLAQTNPEGFPEDRAPGRQRENIIYELHIKDFSQDAASGIPEELRGKYRAFSYLGKEGEPLCMRHLKNLGVTHIHLLPFFDFGWLDEAGSGEQFNWGYDPVNYNVPEGSYSTNPFEGSVRIRECKEMIQALHRAGFRVVMDVVYNHTHDAYSFLERTAPGYFCRRLSDGTLSDGSACGNDMAVGRAMVDNYIVQSVCYWAEEYHIDGFRFDLMGLLTTELMNRIRETLDIRFGRGEKLLYGEPWRAGESPMEAGTHEACKNNILRLHPEIAVFSDDTRDAIKGAVFFAKEPGFVNGGRELEDRILDAVSGWKEHTDGFHPVSCSQIVQYVSAHDNNTLWDKLLFTVQGLPAGEHTAEGEAYLTPYPKVLAANRLAALIYFTCQGNLFFQAGEEFGRTKFGGDNSYRSAPEENMLRWEQLEREGFRELAAYYKGLIALRKKLPGLYDKSPEAAERISGKTIHRAGTVSFLVDNRQKNFPQEESKWSTLYIVYNAAEQDFTVKVPETEDFSRSGGWEILVDEKEADCMKPVSEEVTVKAGSGIILGKRVRKQIWNLSMENRILRRWSEEKKTDI